MILQYLDTIIAFSVVLLGLSLLITVLNQMISTLFGYRGTNLLWGVEKVLSTIDPALAGKARDMATKILTEPIISDSLFSRFKDVPILKSISSRWRIASAISAQDLVHGLRKMASDLRKQEPPDEATAAALDAVLGAVDPEAARKAVLVEKLVQQVAPGAVDKADTFVQQLETSAQQAVGMVEVWFNRAMDRSSQRFAIQMRLWTVAFAVLLAFGAHINSFQVLQSLWNSPETRNNLVNSRDVVMQEAAVVLSPAAPGTAATGPAVPLKIVNGAMKTLQSQDKNAAALGSPLVFQSLDQAIAWLNEKADASHRDLLVAEYQKLVLNDLTDQFKGIKKEIESAGFVLIPSPYPGLFSYGDWRNFAGILVTAAFLSLGAPFWFNALKTLSNLRPLVASRQDASRQAAGG
jgi:hypothetical protein